MFDKLMELLPEQEEPKPNKFTIYMGKVIREAREEAGISQEKLAERIYKRRATLSDIENGKVEVDAGTLALLGYYLKKPLSYFYPEYLRNELEAENLPPLSYELLLHFEQIHGEELQKLAIQLVKVFSEFDPSDLALRLAQSIREQRQQEKELREVVEKRRNKK
jgi:transcriptional regulator with XRE-family HTH domain